MEYLNKNQKLYWDSLTEVTLNWLEFLNSYIIFSYTNGKFWDIAADIEELKEKIINSDSSEVLGEKGNLETDFYSKIRATVSSEISQGLAQYLDYGLNQESQLYLATALSFRKYIRSISWEFLHNLTNLSPEQYRLLNAYIKSLNYAPLKGALPDCSISDELKGLYLESLGIEADSSMSVIAYIQQVLDNLKNIVKILYSTNNRNSLIYNVFMHNYNILSDSLVTDTNPPSNTLLLNIMDLFDEISKEKKKIKRKQISNVGSL